MKLHFVIFYNIICNILLEFERINIEIIDKKLWKHRWKKINRKLLKYSLIEIWNIYKYYH